MENKLSSLSIWFLLLYILITLDILSTNPTTEGNPLTLYLWEHFGIFLSVWIKFGQLLLFGILCLSAKKIAKPNEWIFTKKLLSGLLKILVAFYTFIVTWNLTLSIIF